MIGIFQLTLCSLLLTISLDLIKAFILFPSLFLSHPPSNSLALLLKCHLIKRILINFKLGYNSPLTPHCPDIILPYLIYILYFNKVYFIIFIKFIIIIFTIGKLTVILLRISISGFILLLVNSVFLILIISFLQ